jgi:hypothetical protein
MLILIWYGRVSGVAGIRRCERPEGVVAGSEGLRCRCQAFAGRGSVSIYAMPRGEDEKRMENVHGVRAAG